MGSKILPVIAVLLVLGLGSYALVTVLAPVTDPGITPHRPDRPDPADEPEIQAPPVIETEAKPGIPVVGTVTDPDGTPIPRAWVAAGKTRAVTDDQGRFEIAVAAEVLQAEIKAVAQGYSEGSAVVQVAGASAVRLPEPIVLTPRTGITGRVLDPDGRPLANARVAWQGTTELFDLDVTETDRGGRFEIHDATRVALTLRVRHRDYLPATVEGIRHEKGTRTVVPDIRLEHGGEIIGRVTGPDGKPVADVALLAISESESRGLDLMSLVGVEEEDAAKTDADGSYRLAGLTETAHRLYGHANGWIVPTRESLEVTFGRPLVVDLVLSRGHAIAGIVTDAGGKPITGAKLIVEFADDTVEGDILELPSLSETETDEAGRFRLTGLGEEPVTVTTSAQGYVGAESAGVNPGTEDLRIVLVRGATIQGRVTSAETGEPIPGPQVRLTDQWQTGVSSNIDGGFSLTGVPPGDHELEVRHDDYVPTTFRVIGLKPGERRTGIEIALETGHALTGRVVTADGATPIAYALIQAEGPTDKNAPTDEAGAFSLRGLAAGTYRVRVTTAIAAPTIVEGVVVPQEGDLTIRLEKGATIRGIVRDAEGKPVAGRFIVVMDPEEEEQGQTVTNEKGEFTVTGLPPGEKVVLAVALSVSGRSATGTSMESVTVIVAAGEEAFVEIGGKARVRLATVRGRVLDRGKPVTGRSVLLVRLDLPPGSGLLAGFRMLPVGKDGAWSTSALPPGRYAVLVGPPNGEEFGAAGEMHIPEGGEHTNDIHLAPGRLEGTVVDADGKPVEGVSVALFDSERLSRPLTAVTDVFKLIKGMANADAEGRFVLENVPTGKWLAVAYSKEYAPLVRPAVSIGEAAGTTLDLVLDRGHSFRVVVTGADGKPLRGAALYVYDEAGHWIIGGGEWAPETDAEGVVGMRLPAGRWRVAVQAKGHATAEFDQRIDADRDVSLALTGGGTLRVVVAGPTAGATVRLFAADGREIYRRLSERDMMLGVKPWITGADGTLTLEHLPTGESTVRVTTEDGRTGRGRADIAEGQATEIILTVK